jgi:hypothetical protein
VLPRQAVAAPCQREEIGRRLHRTRRSAIFVPRVSQHGIDGLTFQVGLIFKKEVEYKPCMTPGKKLPVPVPRFVTVRSPRRCYSVPVTPSRQFEPWVRDTLPLSIAITRLPRFYGIIIDDLGRGRRDCQSVLGTPSIDPSKWI